MQQQFTKFVIERAPGVFVSIDGGKTTSLHNARMWSSIERVQDVLSSVWKPGQFLFDIPHKMTGKMDLIGPYTDQIVSTWSIRQINISATVECVD